MKTVRGLLLYLRFVGTNYCGSQVQPNGVSVMQRLQDAIEGVFGARLPIKCCSRTDSGVHANMFCVGLVTEKSIPCAAVVRALNANLPYDMAVYDCREVPPTFHARYDAKGKEYIYKIDNAPVRNPFYHGLAYHYRRPIDEQALDALSKGFVGTQDFRALCAAHSGVKDTVRTVQECEVTRDGELVVFRVQGDGFLYNMVRIMVGTLIRTDETSGTAGDIRDIIQSGDRSRAGFTAPAHGLYLNKVFYDQGVFL